MTLRQLWWMAAGRLENGRAMMLSHSWTIGKLFDNGKTNEVDLERFIQFGTAASNVSEPRSAAVDEKVAEILRTGKVTF